MHERIADIRTSKRRKEYQHIVICPDTLFNLFHLADSGVKTCTLNLRVYNVLYLRISAPLYEARCSKNSDKGTIYVRHRSKAYIRVCIASKAASVLLLARYLAEF